METQPHLKHFGDYRDFLNAHFDYKKIQNKQWSYGLWAKRLGLGATSSLTKIINGEREVGSKIEQSFINYFDFSIDEASYFSDLIRLSKNAHDPCLRLLIMERMGREHPDAHLKVLDDKSFEIISNWFGLTIRELVRLRDFKEDFDWIQSRLRYEVSSQEIKETIQNLLHQGLLKRDQEGKLITSKGLLHTTNDVASSAIKKYHEQMLDIAKQSLHEVELELREFSAETLTLNVENIAEAKEVIRQFKAKFSKMFEEQEGNQTYQLQLQFFPLTKEIK